jgi:hypothetical protein
MMGGNCMICRDPVEKGVAHVSCVSMLMQENSRLREALELIAKQKLIEEMTPQFLDMAKGCFEDAYDYMVYSSRQALESKP